MYFGSFLSLFIQAAWSDNGVLRLHWNWLFDGHSSSVHRYAGCGKVNWTLIKWYYYFWKSHEIDVIIQCMTVLTPGVYACSAQREVDPHSDQDTLHGVVSGLISSTLFFGSVNNYTISSQLDCHRAHSHTVIVHTPILSPCTLPYCHCAHSHTVTVHTPILSLCTLPFCRHACTQGVHWSCCRWSNGIMAVLWNGSSGEPYTEQELDCLHE